MVKQPFVFSWQYLSEDNKRSHPPISYQRQEHYIEECKDGKREKMCSRVAAFLFTQYRVFSRVLQDITLFNQCLCEMFRLPIFISPLLYLLVYERFPMIRCHSHWTLESFWNIFEVIPMTYFQNYSSWEQFHSMCRDFQWRFTLLLIQRHYCRSCMVYVRYNMFCWTS